MPKYRVAEHPEVTEFTYPADPISLREVRNAGGLSQMTPEARERLKFKTVKAGEDCSDMPEPALSIYVGRGWVVSSDAQPVEAPKNTEEPAENEDKS